MIIFTKRLVLLTLVLHCVGCIYIYEQPSFESGQYADLEIVHSVSGTEYSTFLHAYDNDECKNTEGFGKITKVGKQEAGRRHSFRDFARLWTGKRLYLGSEIQRRRVLFDTIETELCTVMVSFVPLEGHYYILKQFWVGDNKCGLSIIDKETQQPPEGVVAHDVKKACRDKRSRW